MFRFRIRLRLPRNLPHACARGDDAHGHVHARDVRGHGLRHVRVHARLLQLHLLPDVYTSRQRHKLFQSRMNVSKEFLQHQPFHGQFR